MHYTFDGIPDDAIPRAHVLGDILRHQLRSERRFFGEFLGLPEVPAASVMPNPLTTRTAVTVYLRLLGRPVPSTYGPTGDEKWAGADPTTTVEAAARR